MLIAFATLVFLASMAIGSAILAYRTAHEMSEGKWLEIQGTGEQAAGFVRTWVPIALTLDLVLALLQMPLEDDAFVTDPYVAVYVWALCVGAVLKAMVSISLVHNARRSPRTWRVVGLYAATSVLFLARIFTLTH